MLTSKWRMLNHNCQKFNAIFKRSVRLGKSGENDLDVMKQARATYRDENKGTPFVQEDASEILRSHAKWDSPDPVDFTERDVPGVGHEDLFGNNSSNPFSEHMSTEFCLKGEAAEKATRFQSKLSSWKANLLSIGGRHTLIKVVLGSLGSHEAGKLAWIKWKNVLSSYDNGGLNIGSLKTFNLALLQKWRWRLYRLESEKDCLIIDRINHGQWRWNWSRPNLGAQNSTDLLDMLFEISSAKINEVEDACVWSLGNDETFSVNDTRCIIDSKILPSFAPSTVISYTSCNGNMESLNHIFFECNIAKDIWMLVRKWCDISFPPFTSYEHWKCWFTSWQVVKEKSRRLSVIFSSSLWWL
ncbi:hypothetical protein Tco_1363121 [Tanacetum coccineum]